MGTHVFLGQTAPQANMLCWLRGKLKEYQKGKRYEWIDARVANDPMGTKQIVGMGLGCENTFGHGVDRLQYIPGGQFWLHYFTMPKVTP